MKVLHLINDLDVGGAEIMLLEIAKEHAKMDVEMIVVSLSNIGLIGEQINQAGIRTVELGMKPGHFSFGAFRTLVKLIRSFHPDIVQTWMYHSDLLGSLAGIITGNLPVVWGIHHTLGKGSTLKTGTRNIVRLNAILSHWLPARVVCCSKASMDTHLSHGYFGRNMLIIQNGVDTEKFKVQQQARQSLRKELGLDESTKLIGMMARFHPQKDHKTFVMAAKKLHENMPDVHFVLAGKDIQKNNEILMGWIKSVYLEDYIHLLGLRSDIPRLMAGLDVGTLTSSYGEAMPLSICEAMACGIPCVVTDVGDAKEIVGQTGFCVQPEDTDQIAKGWENMLCLNSDEYTLQSDSARRRILEEYNLPKSAQNYLDVYIEVSCLDI